MTYSHVVKAIFYGGLLWLIVTALVAAVYGFGLCYKLENSAWLELAAALIAGGVALIFAKEAGISSVKQASWFTILWVAILLELDFSVIAPLTTEVFQSWQYWFGHALIFVAPWIVLKYNLKD